MAVSTLLIVGVAAAVGEGAEKITSSVMTKNREEEIQTEQAKQSMQSLDLQKARAGLASSEQASKRAQQAENVLAAQKVMAAARGTLGSPTFGSLVAGSASNFDEDNRVAQMNLTMTDDNLTAQQIQVQKNLNSQEKSDNFQMWSGIGSALVGTAGNIYGAATGYQKAQDKPEPKGAPRDIDSAPSMSAADNDWANNVPTNYFGG